MNSTKPSEIRQETIIRLYLEGGSLRLLGRRFGVSHERIRQILADGGVSLRGRGRVSIKVKPAFGKLTTRERLLKNVKVVPDAARGEHWVWVGIRHAGYGRFCFKGATHYAHRAAYYIRHGRLPKGRLYKECLIQGCVNPQHWHELDPQMH